MEKRYERKFKEADEKYSFKEFSDLIKNMMFERDTPKMKEISCFDGNNPLAYLPEINNINLNIKDRVSFLNKKNEISVFKEEFINCKWSSGKLVIICHKHDYYLSTK